MPLALYPMHRVFISYHHARDQYYKNYLIEMNRVHRVFVDMSVNTGDISDELSDEAIRRKIRDEYLRDSTVTILLVGQETRNRKHIDWEIYSSMVDGAVNKKSGILVVELPDASQNNWFAAHQNEGIVVYPGYTDWSYVSSRSEFAQRHQYLPDRILDCLGNGGHYISIVPWNRIDAQPLALSYLIDACYNDRTKATYDLSRPMRRANS